MVKRYFGYSIAGGILVLSHSYVYLLYYLVDCSGSTLGSAYSYSPPIPSLLGTSISVTCASGYESSLGASGGSLTANCTNKAGCGTWQIVDDATCMCKFYVNLLLLLNGLCCDCIYTE